MLERLREQHAVVVEIPRPDVRDEASLAEAVERDAAGARRGRRRRVQATFADEDMTASPTSSCASVTAPTRCRTRSSRARRRSPRSCSSRHTPSSSPDRVAVAPSAVLILGDGTRSEHASPTSSRCSASVARTRPARGRTPRRRRPVAWGDAHGTSRAGAAGVRARRVKPRATSCLSRACVRRRARGSWPVGSRRSTSSRGAPSPSPGSRPRRSPRCARRQLQLGRPRAPPPSSSSTRVPSRRSRSRTRATSSSTSRATRSTPSRARRTRPLGARLPLRPRRGGRHLPGLLGALARRGDARCGSSSTTSPNVARASPGCTYHYASCERTHLLSIAARHGMCEEEVDDLLREGRARRPVSRRARGAARGLALVLPQEDRAALPARGPRGECDRGRLGRGVRRYRLLREEGRDEAEALLAQIADYNEDDCRSTLALRVARRAGCHAWGAPGTAPRPGEGEPGGDKPPGVPSRWACAPSRASRPTRSAAPSSARSASRVPRSTTTAASARASGGRTRPAQAAGRHVGGHARRRDRARGHGGCRLAPRDPAPVAAPAPAVRGEVGPGSAIGPGTPVFMVYEPADRASPPAPAGSRQAHASIMTILEASDDGSFLLEERLRKGVEGTRQCRSPSPPGRRPWPTRSRARSPKWAEGVLEGQPGCRSTPSATCCHADRRAPEAVEALCTATPRRRSTRSSRACSTSTRPTSRSRDPRDRQDVHRRARDPRARRAGLKIRRRRPVARDGREHARRGARRRGRPRGRRQATA